MSEENKGVSDAPVDQGSAEGLEQGQSASGSQDSVKYDTYRKTLSEAKKSKAQLTEAMERLQMLEQEKLQAEGKTQELLQSVIKERDSYKSRLAEAHGAFAQGRAMDAIIDEANKMGVASTGLLRKAIGDKVNDLEFDDEYRPNSEQVKMLLESIRQEEPLLFSKQAPKVADHKFNPQAGQTKGKALKDMSKDELIEYWSNIN